ncbi:ribonuclease P protein component [Inhella sp.]|uniref:ribonuclease P protein component n=1 Tax=Inhella sp. TaxID=1921806 RepID=UPI0035B33141
MPSPLGRILRAADFERLLKTPSRARSPLFAVHHVEDRPSVAPRPSRLSTGSDQLTHRVVDDSPATRPDAPAGVTGHWLGFVVPKRLARRSVTRNLIRRLGRASLQSQLSGASPLPPGLWVLRLRTPIAKAEFQSADSAVLRKRLREDLDLLWRRALNPLPPGRPPRDKAPPKAAAA